MRLFSFRRGRGKMFLYAIIFAALCGGTYTQGISGISEALYSPGKVFSSIKNFFSPSESGASLFVTEDSGLLDSYDVARLTAGDVRETMILKKQGYTVQYSLRDGIPCWVSWHLKKENLNGPVERTDEFLADDEIPSRYRVESYDYKGSGYDRGHMCPAADNKYSEQAMKESFLMTNMCPQNHTLNAESWERLEKACRRWAGRWGDVYVVCGPVFQGHERKTIGKEHEVRVPDGFFKAVLCMQPGKEKSIAFLYANTSQRQTMEGAMCSVDDIEALIGMDLFCNVPEPLQTRIEGSYDLRAWDSRNKY